MLFSNRRLFHEVYIGGGRLNKGIIERGNMLAFINGFEVEQIVCRNWKIKLKVRLSKIFFISSSHPYCHNCLQMPSYDVCLPLSWM